MPKPKEKNYSEEVKKTSNEGVEVIEMDELYSFVEREKTEFT